jgi:hypothetical protein
MTTAKAFDLVRTALESVASVAGVLLVVATGLSLHLFLFRSTAEAAQTSASARPTACVVSSIYDLAQCVRVGDEIRVTLTGDDGPTIEGVFHGYADEHLVLEVDHRFRYLADEDVNEISRLPSRGERTRRGMLIGLATGVLCIGPLDPGVSGGEIASRTAACSAGGAAAFGLLGRAGAGFGLKPTVVMTRDLAIPTRPATTPSAAAEPTLSSDVVRLSQRLSLGDQVRVKLLGGTLVTGAYAGVDDGALLVRRGDRIEGIQDGQVMAVSRRTWHHPSAVKGAIIGAAVGGLLSIAFIAEERSSADPTAERLTWADHAVGIAFSAGVGAGVTRLMGREDQLLMVKGQALPSVPGPGPVAGFQFSLSVRF